jgi:hypothetical protein
MKKYHLSLSRALNLSGVFNLGMLPDIGHPYWFLQMNKKSGKRIIAPFAKPLRPLRLNIFYR